MARSEEMPGPVAARAARRLGEDPCRGVAMNTEDPSPCLAIRGDGVLLQLSVMPNARRTEVDGLHDGALRVRLAAPPIDGRANEALVAWLAKSLGVARRDVELLRG